MINTILIIICVVSVYLNVHLFVSLMVSESYATALSHRNEKLEHMIKQSGLKF